jgi:tetratricopeptide (TPR) repeat protein
MRRLILVLPAVLCFAQEPGLPSQLARLQRLPTDELRALQARLAVDPAPAEKKAYHELHLAYALASRSTQEDPKGSKALVERSLKTFENTPDPESKALVAAFLGLKIGFSPMAAMTLSGKATRLFEEALAKQPASPRIALLQAVQLLHTPAFVGGGAKAALPLMEKAVKLAEQEAAPADPWAPAWGHIESLGWLAYTQVEAGLLPEARATIAQVLALDPGNPFVTRMVQPRLQAKAK